MGRGSFSFFGTSDFREMNLAYEFAEYMPGSVSFAMDGSSNHYIFDMRETWRSVRGIWSRKMDERKLV